MSTTDRGLLEIFLDEARALLPRIGERDRSAAAELVELAAVVDDAELVELATALLVGLERGHDPAPLAKLVGGKLAAIAAPVPLPSTWDPVELAEMRALFLVEARNALAAIEASLLALAADPEAHEPFEMLLRKAHTLKGSAGSVDLHGLSAAAHRLEDLLTPARKIRDASVIAAAQAAVPELRRLVGLDAASVDEEVLVAPDSQSLDALRVDELLDAASELVLDRTRIERRLRSVDELAVDASPQLRAQLAELSADVATLARTTRRLGERLRRVRAIDFQTLVNRLETVVRSVALRERKQVHVIARGVTEEIDQRLADALLEPLLHALRNAVVHGVELPAARVAAGKPAAATITLVLRQTGDGFELEVSDDGGVDLAAVRRALVVADRLTDEEAAQLSDQALLATLFQPGISTRVVTDELAGRGVGLDAVADAIARLGGDVSLDTTAGVGTRLTIHVPVESRVLEALLFKVGDQVFAVPSARVEEVAEVDKDAIDDDVAHIRIGDEQLALVRLGALLRIPRPPGLGGKRAAIVLDSRGQRFAATCDRLIGPREIVVRRLPRALVGARPWAGATISGAGKVQLIFDVDALAQLGAGKLPRPSYPAGPKRVLVVDEARSLREAVALVLEHAGLLAERAPDGWEALERLADRPFDLLVFRHEQKGLPGPRLVDRIRASPHLRKLPIVMLTDLDERSALKLVGPFVQAIVSLPLRRRPLLDAVARATKGPSSPG